MPTKISNEMIAHSYSHLYNLNTIGLRFLQFMVHGAGRTWQFLNLLKIFLKIKQ